MKPAVEGSDAFQKVQAGEILHLVMFHNASLGGNRQALLKKVFHENGCVFRGVPAKGRKPALDGYEPWTAVRMKVAVEFGLDLLQGTAFIKMKENQCRINIQSIGTAAA